ncbi:hypothetical protein N7462_000225 [Penicillium macrosclerotiorum]|uniref:uncharacterized protein n=1 Tax=Penicillium macrosclerotiorum TaxID=303699 RepID=UPI00254874D6|nr:uncharacterized protein N7462_000225 [Penicillium macrosclerotiorum]KAJ5698220.1 hypothetical protein N7462_000225 [Penicillium macrosclerotiorum]
MLPTVQRRPPALSPPAPIVHPATPYDGPETRLHSLFHAIDKCLALSAIPDALHSLLCSAFFDPRIPCTFLSAASLGITHALSLHTQPDHLTLLTALSRKAPHLVLPWDSLVVNGLAYPLLRIALGMLPCSLSPALESNLPPLCLLAAFWTGTLQSFLQVSYTQNQNHSDSIRIPRVHEFSIAFFCNPDAAVPWSPAPPFGSSMRTNLSLAVSAHCAHNHRPRSYAVFWSLKSGEKQQAGEVLEPRSHRAQIVEYPRCAYSPTTEETKEPLRQPDMQNQSWAATSRLFNWHRAYDGGLWLEDGRMDMEEIRKLQAHSWIKEPWSDDENEPVAEEEEEEEEEESRPGIDRAGVSEWIESLKEQTAKTIEISLEGSCA